MHAIYLVALASVLFGMFVDRYAPTDVRPLAKVYYASAVVFVILPAPWT